MTDARTKAIEALRFYRDEWRVEPLYPATAIEALEARVRELEGEMQRRTDEWAALLHSANEARRRGEAALATERERADKLWDALLWLDTNDPEIIAAAEDRFGLNVRDRALKTKEPPHERT